MGFMLMLAKNPFNHVGMTQKAPYIPILVGLGPKLWSVTLKLCQRAYLSDPLLASLDSRQHGAALEDSSAGELCRIVVQASCRHVVASDRYRINVIQNVSCRNVVASNVIIPRPPTPTCR